MAVKKEEKNGSYTEVITLPCGKKKTKVRLYFNGKDCKTKQEFKEECQIQTILNKYQKTGMVSHFAKYQGEYGDFSNVASFQDAAVQMTLALDSFMELPSSIRSKFDNNPSKLHDFLSNEANYDEAVKIGLVAPKTVDPIPEVGSEKVVSEPVSEPQTPTA